MPIFHGHSDNFTIKEFLHVFVHPVIKGLQIYYRQTQKSTPNLSFIKVFSG